MKSKLKAKILSGLFLFELFAGVAHCQNPDHYPHRVLKYKTFQSCDSEFYEHPHVKNIYKAVINGDTGALEKLLPHGTEPCGSLSLCLRYKESTIRVPLLYIAIKQHYIKKNYPLKIIKMLADNSEIADFVEFAPVDIEIGENKYREINLSVLHLAALGNDTKAVDLLLKAFKRKTKDIDIIKLLGDRYVDVQVEDEQYYPLYFALRRQNYEMTKILLRNQATVSLICTEDGYTPWYFAAQNGFEFVKLLIKYDKETRDYSTATGMPEHTDTPLMVAVRNFTDDYDEPTANAVVELEETDICASDYVNSDADRSTDDDADPDAGYSADDESKDHHRKCSFKYCDTSKIDDQENIVYALSKALPQIINNQDMVGNTALHLAAIHGNLKAVRVLVKNGANVYIKNYANQRAVDLTTDNLVRRYLQAVMNQQLTLKDLQPSAKRMRKA